MKIEMTRGEALDLAIARSRALAQALPAVQLTELGQLNEALAADVDRLRRVIRAGGEEFFPANSGVVWRFTN